MGHEDNAGGVGDGGVHIDRVQVRRTVPHGNGSVSPRDTAGVRGAGAGGEVFLV